MWSIDLSWVSVLIIGLLTFYFVKYIIDIKSLPPGPLPLPLIGNVLLFWGNKNNLHRFFDEMKNKYHGIYTLWIGSVPTVFVADWELAKEGLLTKRNDIISRPNIKSVTPLLEHGDAIVFQPNNKEWEVCRKVGHTAIRKFADGEVLATIVRDNTDEMLRIMTSKQAPFNPKDQIQESLFAIIAQTAFGFNKLTEAERNIFRNVSDNFHENMNVSPGDFIPLLSPFFGYVVKKNLLLVEKSSQFMKEKFNLAKNGYNYGELRHFTDSVISSAIEAEKEESQSKTYLTDHHLQKILGDLFIAGTDTTALSLTWSFLALATFPDVQERIRKEIDDNIGTNMPLQEHKKYCPYTWAFISEILRLRPAVPMLLPHATNVDTSLGGRKIPKGTTVVFDINAVHLDPNLWEDPLEFKPERFLDSEGNYSNKKLPGYLPFSDGKRMCIGEKMARNDLFLLITNLMQKAQIIYHGPEVKSVLARENNVIANMAEDYQVQVVPRTK